MKKYAIVLSTMILFSACSSLEGNLNKNIYNFDKMVSRPFLEQDRKKLEKEFKNLKKQLQNEEISLEKKRELEKEIDYYLMILEDLKD